MPMANLVGVQTRIDNIRDVGIFPTFERRVIGSTQNAGVFEASGAAYAESSIHWLPYLQIIWCIPEYPGRREHGSNSSSRAIA
jgi:hypothetical protein